MRCPNCGTENPEGAQFCSQCRAPLAGVIAQAAGAETQPPGPSAPPPGPPPPPEAQPPGPMAPPPPMGAYYYPPPTPAPVGRQRFPTWGIIGGGLAGLLLCCICIAAAILVLALIPRPGPTPPPTPGQPTQPTTTQRMQIVFCKDIPDRGDPVGCGDVFSTRDPKIVQATLWGESRLPAGTRLSIDWFVGNVKAVESQSTLRGTEPGHILTVSPPQDGWPAGRYEVQVSINGARAATASFTIR